MILEDLSPRYCDACFAENPTEAVANFASVDSGVLIRRRAEGTDSAHCGEAGRKRGQRNAEHVVAISAWEHQHIEQINQVVVTRDMIPRLYEVPRRTMADANGLSIA